MNIQELLQLTVERRASDLHIVAGVPPYLRVDGELIAVPNEPVLTPQETKSISDTILTPAQKEVYAKGDDVDFSLAFSEKARFRVNAYTQKGSIALAFRRIALEIPAVDSLGLPTLLHNFASLKQGFVLVTGPTGHGKSTTLAAVINEINESRPCHIVTIEDPIEYVFRPKKAIISQREMGTDTNSWKMALRSVLREDPDVCFIGEMRDTETISSALTIAETGHLVFSTLHTNSAAQTVDRIVDAFPDEQQSQVRLQLSSTLAGVFSQRLIPGIDGKRVVAYELMLASSAIKTTIRDAKTHQIDNIIQTSQAAGMATLEASLAKLVRDGRVSMDVAESYSLRPGELARIVRGAQ